MKLTADEGAAVAKLMKLTADDVAKLAKLAVVSRGAVVRAPVERRQVCRGKEEAAAHRRS